MGSEEQIAKRESRPGDLIAKFAALVSSDITYHYF
jgi:hypothetical protein